MLLGRSRKYLKQTSPFRLYWTETTDAAEEIDEIVREARVSVPHFHILAGKEIKNYLLVPLAIMRAIADRFKEQKLGGTCSLQTLEKMIETIVNDTKSGVLSQHISNRMRHFDRRTSKDPATVAGEAISHVDKEWQDPSRRLLIVPGKQVLAALNTELQARLSTSYSNRPDNSTLEG